MTRDPLVGQTVQGFRILERMGAGGMGEVYLAHEESLGRKVVLKFLAARFADDEELVRRFSREARAAARLNHPNVVTIYSVHETGGRPFIAMEHVQGESLDRLIGRKKQLGIARSLAISAQIADALASAHEAGILHRDIKPSNIIVTPNGVVKVLDFGIAKIMGEQTDLTSNGTFLGTVAYASPEQCEAAQLDARSDVYSFGIVLYEMLAGRPPYVGDTPLSLIKRIATEPPPDLDGFNPSVPGPVKDLIGRMIEKDRDQRIRDCETVGREIRRILETLGQGAPDLRAAAAGGLEDTVVGDETATLMMGEGAEVPLGRPISTSEIRGPGRRRVIWAAAVLLVLLGIAAAIQSVTRDKTRVSASPTPTVSPTPSTSPTPAATAIAIATATPWPSITPVPTPTPARSLSNTPRGNSGWRTPAVQPTVAPTPAATQTPPQQPLTAAAALRFVPRDRDLVIGFNPRQLLQTPLFRSHESKVFSNEAITRLNVFYGQFGIDWRNDIERIVLSGINNRGETLGVIFQGRWSEQAVVARLEREPGYRRINQGAWPIHSVLNTQERRMDCLMFLQPGVAVCGTLQTVRQTAETAAQRSPSILAAPPMRNAVETLGAQSDFWAIGLPELKPMGRGLNDLDAWILKGRLTSDLFLEGTAWPRSRTDIERAYKGLVFIVDLWRNNKQNAELRSLAQNIRLRRTVGSLSVGLRVPYADLVALLDRAAREGNYPFK